MNSVLNFFKKNKIVIGLGTILSIIILLYKKVMTKKNKSIPVVEKIEDDVINTIKDEQEVEKKNIANITSDVSDDTILTDEVINKIKNNGLTEAEIESLDKKLKKKGSSLQEEITKILGNVEKI